MKVKDKLLIFKCLKCNKSHKKYLNKYLVKRFVNTYKFSDNTLINFAPCLGNEFMNE